MHAALERRLLAAQQLPEAMKTAVDQRLAGVRPPGASLSTEVTPTGIRVTATRVPVVRTRAQMENRTLRPPKAVSPAQAIARLRRGIVAAAGSAVRKVIA